MSVLLALAAILSCLSMPAMAWAAGSSKQVIAQARETGLARLTLTTFRDVPFNAPFYARLGFRIVDESHLSLRLARIRQEERLNGCELAPRVAMVLAEMVRFAGEWLCPVNNEDTDRFVMFRGNTVAEFHRRLREVALQFNPHFMISGNVFGGFGYGPIAYDAAGNVELLGRTVATISSTPRSRSSSIQHPGRTTRALRSPTGRR